MKKIFKMQNLDCANCAAKMEDKISKINGVKSAKISFLTQRFTLECEESEIERIFLEAQKICKKFEPDCTILRG